MDQELFRAIGRIEGKLDAIHEDVGEIKQEAQETNGRVTSLEQRADKQRGAMAVISAIAAFLGGLLTMIVRG
jgi:uncharacterized coiled-coil DUF342 family protein